MKKKKLKKRIKKLEKGAQTIIDKTTEALNAHREMIGNLGEKYTELREDFNRFNQRYNTDLEVLKKRTDIDYTQFSKPIVDTSKGPDDATPNCETCKYKGFDALFTHSPCYGCTAGNYKMYEPKED